MSNSNHPLEGSEPFDMDEHLRPITTEITAELALEKVEDVEKHLSRVHTKVDKLENVASGAIAMVIGLGVSNLLKYFGYNDFTTIAAVITFFVVFPLIRRGFNE